MKNLFKTRRTKIYLGIIASAVFAVTIALFANFKPSLFRNASAANDYTITFNRDNGGAGFPSSYGSGTNSSGHTSKGNQISFTYNNAKSTSSKFCTLANGGYLYNSTAITGLESVEVGFSGGSLSLYSSKSTTFDGDAESLTTGSALSIAANYDYFKLVASGETAIEYIEVFYTCSAREEKSYYVKVNETSQVTSGQYLIVYESGSVALNLQTEEDVANNGTSVTIVEDKIESTSATDVLAFTLDDTNGSLLAPCGKYITHTGSKNTLNFSDSAVGHDISVEDGVANIEVTSQSYHIAYNNNTDQKRFRYYLNSDANVALFKLNGESGGGTVVTNYTITYMSNGGTGTMEPTSGTNPVVASCSFTAPSGQEFSKWNTAANGSGTDVAVGTALSADTTLYAIWEASSSGGSSTFELFSGTIEEGDYIITYDDCAMNTTVTSTRLQYDSVTPVNDVITDPSDDIIWHIAPSGNYWTIYNEKANAYAASTGAKNKAQMLSDGTSDKAKWTITGSSTYDFENLDRSNGSDSGNKWLRKNGTYGFACYASGTGGELTLYKSAEATPQGPVSVSGVSLNHVSAEITNETGIQLVATVSPSNATNKNVSWSSDKPGIASVDQSGNVTGVSAGTAIITVTTEDGNKTATCEVTVTMIVHVTGVSLDHTSLDLHPGEQDSLTATVAPSNASNKNVTWSTNASSVATVNNGTVTAVSAGTATITVTTEDGSKTATCTVTVTNVAVTGVTLNKSSLTLTRLDSETLIATITPSNATNKNINWSSSNTSVASVSGGTVTAVAQGTATITARSSADNTKFATCTVTVNPISVTGVTLDKSALDLYVGGSETLTATVAPADADIQTVTWSSDHTNIATVTSAGKVTAVAVGTATITVTTTDGGHTASCTVTVSEEPETPAETQYVFTGATWTATSGGSAANWTSGKAGAGYSNSGVQVTSGASGANATSPISFSGVQEVVVSYCTNASKGVGSIEINIGGKSNTLSVTKEGGTTARNLTFTFDPTVSGNVKITVTCTTNSIYICGITIKTANIAATDFSLTSPFEITAGASNKTIPVTYSPAGANKNTSLTWSKVSGSSNISITSDGVISAVNAVAGNSAVVSAMLDSDNTKVHNCTVNVVEVQNDAHTILIYMCGSDLESGNQFGTKDINEILKTKASLPDNVNIVMETGGSNSNSNYFSTTNMYRWHLEKTGFVKDSTFANQNMSDSSTLQEFLVYGLTNYPADKTGLILWDHGGAMGGVCCDELNKVNGYMESLTASEVKTAVSGALSDCHMSGQKLEWIGYDACLMGVADVASVNSDYFNYMVGSEELEGGPGWNYDGWLPTLYESPSNTTTILDTICSSFIEDPESDVESTLAAYDLSKMSAFTSAFNTWSNNFTSKSHFTSLKSIYSNCLKFGDAYHEGEFLNSVVDAKDFINKIKSSSAFSSISNTNLIIALNNLIISNYYGSYYTGTQPCGITIFFAGDDEFNGYPPQTERDQYTTNDTKFTHWKDFNLNYGNWLD